MQHVHIKDTLIHNRNLRLKGFTDSTYPTQPRDRAYTFTIPGWGHDDGVWREVIATLRLIGYDDILSMEMECEYMNIEEGLKKAIAFMGPSYLKNRSGNRGGKRPSLANSGRKIKEVIPCLCNSNL